MSNEYPNETDIEYWYRTAGLTPEDFYILTQDTNHSKHLAVTVAMFLGWLPHKRECPKCKGTMKRGKHENLQDRLNWKCNNDGPRLSKKSKKDKKKSATSKNLLGQTHG